MMWGIGKMGNNMILQRWMLMLAVLFSLAACGNVPSTAANAGGTNATLAATSLSNYTVNVGSVSVSISNNGKIVQGTPQAVTATVIDSAGVAVSNAVVTFTTDALVGVLTPANGTALTDIYGHASVSLDAVAAGAATITATTSINGVAVTGGTNYSTLLAGGSVASIVGLSAGKYIVLTGGVDSTQITATVQDAANAAIANATVTFHTTAGLLTASQSLTDAYGRASVSLSSGSSPANVLADVYATVGNIESAHLPISIQGTKITLSGKSTSLSNALPYTSDAVTVTVVDGGNTPVPNQHISISSMLTNSIATAAKLGLQASAYKGFAVDSYTYNATTNVSGQVVLAVDAYSNANGVENNPSTLVVCLDPYSANSPMSRSTCLAQSTGSKVFRPYQITGAAFGISAPTVDNYTMNTYSTVQDVYTIAVSNATPNTAVTFSTSLGKLVNPSGAVIQPFSALKPSGWSAVTVNTSATGSASVDFYSATGGLATIQASTTINAAQQTSLTHIVVSPPIANAVHITLQAASNVLAAHTTQAVAPSTNLTATVNDVSGFPVAQVPVTFSLGNATGGGESVSPSFAYTNNAGVATAVFTAGTQSSGAQGVDIYASIATSSPNKPAKANVIIGGTAGSVTIGRGTTTVVLDPATYQLAMSVVVADSNGSPVSGAQVTLNAWPSYFSFGKRVGTPCPPIYSLIVDPYSKSVSPSTADLYSSVYNGRYQPVIDAYAASFATWIPNEDANMNLMMDPYEDIMWKITTSAALQNDNALTPANSVAGTLPASVVTDVNGVATFNLTYLKAHAQWVKDKITARTTVAGSESRGSVEFVLPELLSDSCFLPKSSPFNAPTW